MANCNAVRCLLAYRSMLAADVHLLGILLPNDLSRHAPLTRPTCDGVLCACRVKSRLPPPQGKGGELFQSLVVGTLMGMLATVGLLDWCAVCCVFHCLGSTGHGFGFFAVRQCELRCGQVAIPEPAARGAGCALPPWWLSARLPASMSDAVVAGVVRCTDRRATAQVPLHAANAAHNLQGKACFAFPCFAGVPRAARAHVPRVCVRVQEEGIRALYKGFAPKVRVSH